MLRFVQSGYKNTKFVGLHFRHLKIFTRPGKLIPTPWLLWLIPGKHCWQSPDPAVYRQPWPPWFASPRCTPSPTPESHFSPPAPPHGLHTGYDLHSDAAVGVEKNNTGLLMIISALGRDTFTVLVAIKCKMNIDLIKISLVHLYCTLYTSYILLYVVMFLSEV